MRHALRRTGHAILAIAAAFALYAVGVGLVAPHFVRTAVVERLHEALGRPVTLERVTLDPFTWHGSLQGLRILEPDGRTPFFSLASLEFAASPRSLQHRAPVLDALAISGVEARLVRVADGHYNVDDIVRHLHSRAESKAPGSHEEPMRFSLQHVQLSHAAIDFDDQPRGRKHRISDITLAVPSISNLPVHVKDRVEPVFSAKVNGAQVTLHGGTQPFDDSLRSDFDIDVHTVDLPAYVAYIPGDLGVKIDRGKLDAKLSVRFAQGPKEPAVDVSGTASLRDVALSTPQGALASFEALDTQVASAHPLRGTVKIAWAKLTGARAMRDEWRVASARVDDVSADLGRREVRVGALATEGGDLVLRRDRDGSVQLPQVRNGEGNASASPWTFSLDRAGVTGWRLAVHDATVSPEVTHRVAVQSLTATDISTQGGLHGNLEAKLAVGEGGLVQASSKFALEPLRVEADIDARGIDLVPLRAYAQHFRTVALKSGSASAKGELTLEEGKGGTLHVGYTGSAGIDGLATRDTLTRSDLLNWKSVRATGMKVDYAESSPVVMLRVADVVVDGAYSRIIVTPQGRLNVQQLRYATLDEPEGAAPSTPPRARDVRIDRIRFANSRLDFTDHYIRPNYSADVRELHGFVRGLSSDPKSRAVVELDGRWDNSSPVVIAGTVNALAADLFLDVGAKGQDIELTKLSAYSQRYAGYGIRDGRLTLDVKYHIENGKMEGRNRIVIDQLAFGDKVESPDATQLPVLFAMNLLKDENGRIDLEIPISGSLEDPRFDLGALIGNVVGSFFRKAITSPFSLITAALGGNGSKAAGSAGADDLGFVEFEPGDAELGAPARDKLERLARALHARPAVKLEIAAHADEAKDAEALRAEALRERLEAAPKDLPPEVRAKLEEEPVEIGPSQLAALAERRGSEVKSFLLANGELAAERISVAAASPGEPAQARSRRVDFALH